MRRDLSRLESEEHDLLVIGAGIQGACIAWDAALRGLRVALVERDDFGAATSANSLRIIHGGLRYLARGDFPRMRESIRERSALLRIAPGLVEPLPVLIPTGPPGMPSRLALGAALALTHVFSPRRNRDLPPARRIPAGRLLSRRECLELLPALETAPVTGGALWYDARMTRPERLTLAFVLSAAARGAIAANYAEADAFDVARGAVRAVEVVDRLSGRRHAVRARQIVVAAGPWTEELASRAERRAPRAGPPRLALGMNLVLGRRLGDAAVGLRAVSPSPDDPGGSGARFLFTVPQQRTTLLGTWYQVADGDDPAAALDRGEEYLLSAANRACPGLGLTPEDVVGRQVGRLPLKAGLERGPAFALAERPKIQSRGASGPSNLLTVEAVKYTTARAVAEHVVDAVLASLGLEPRGCRTAETPLVAGEASAGASATAPLEQRLRRAVSEEMAATLSDVVFRRTELGDPPGPEEDDVRLAARVVGDALGWDERRRSEEEATVLRAEAV